MARCSCGNSACSCIIKGAPGGGVTVTGDGSPARPYELGLTSGGNPLDSLIVADTPTLDLSISGAGTPTDKKRITGVVTAKVADLSDVSKTDIPVTGDVMQWNGSQWVFAPPGATSVPVSAIWGTAPLAIYGTDSLIGPEIYLDSNGQIRGRPSTLLVTNTGFTNATPASSYPRGLSMMSIPSANNPVAAGWPQSAVYAEVVTYRVNADSVIQTFSRTTTGGAQTMFVRTGNDTTWGAWAWVGGQAPHYSASKPANQALTTANTLYTITYDTVVTNEGGITYAGGIFTVPIAGKYDVRFNQHLQVTGSPTFTVNMLKNGSIIQAQSHGAVNANRNIEINRMVKCAAGDQLSVQIRSTLTGAVAYGTAGTPYSTADITLIGG